MCDFDLKANPLSTVISDVNYHLQLLSMKQLDISSLKGLIYG